jgi:hypothetical protein
LEDLPWPTNLLRRTFVRMQIEGSVECVRTNMVRMQIKGLFECVRTKIVRRQIEDFFEQRLLVQNRLRPKNGLCFSFYDEPLSECKLKVRTKIVRTKPASAKKLGCVFHSMTNFCPNTYWRFEQRLLEQNRLRPKKIGPCFSCSDDVGMTN